ncbi:MAG: protoporphyrinogen oxidase [Melioribacteraceae bacterium]|nr:protoporphyrinogen oxidase [Melioribacteraceae bacterium]
MNKDVLVLGAGISGLATAYWLKKEGFNVKILERNDEPGGAMETINENGFLIDFGPNSGLETTPLIAQLAEEIGIQDQMIYANEAANIRYILKNNQLMPLPTSPQAFLKTNLFSAKAKLRLMAEPFIGKSNDGYYQSMSEFVVRRLGQEFLDYAIDPFVSGVFAGDPSKLSVKSAFPKLYRLEEIYGGLIKGTIKGARERKKNKEKSKQSAKMFSFINGMQTFPKAISNQLSDIEYNTQLKKIEKLSKGFKVYYSKNGEEKSIETEKLLSTIPAYVLSSLINFDDNLKSHLNDIYYPPVMVLYLGFDKKDINRELDGFGYLIPSKEKKSYLGAIWSSTIFPNRAEDDKASFTLFIGGARSPHLFESDTNKLIDKVINEFKQATSISGVPVIMRHKLWNKAIPQYNIGYIEHERYFEQFEKENNGFFLSGNYRGGISVGDCVKNSEITFNRIVNNV